MELQEIFRVDYTPFEGILKPFLFISCVIDRRHRQHRYVTQYFTDVGLS